MVINKVLLKMKQSLIRSTGGANLTHSQRSEASLRSNATGNHAAISSRTHCEEIHMERNIETPGERDILLGRGRTSWSHTGNQQFRSFIGMYLKQYTESKNRTEKTKTVHLIYDEIIQARGRFLKLDTATKTWYQVARSVAREKIAHTLRDAVGLRIKLTVPDNSDGGGTSGADAANILLGGGGRSASKSKSGGGSIFAQKPPKQEEAKTAPSPFPLFSATTANDMHRPQLFVAKDTIPDDSISAEEVLSSSTETRSNVSILSSSQAGGGTSVHQGSCGSGSAPHRSFIPVRKKNRAFPDGDGRPHSGGLSSVNSGSARSADKKSFNDLVNSMITELEEDQHSNDAASVTMPNPSATKSSKNTTAVISNQRQEQQLQEQRRLHQEQQLSYQEQQLYNHHDFGRQSADMVPLADDDLSAGFSAMSLETSKSGRSFKSSNMSPSKCDSKHSSDGSQTSAMFELSEEFRTARSHSNTPSPTNGHKVVGAVGIQSRHEQDLLLRHRRKVANGAQPSMFDDSGLTHQTTNGYMMHHDENCGTSFGGDSMDWAKGGDVVSEMGSLDGFSLVSRETGHSSFLTKNSRNQQKRTREKYGSSQDSRKDSSMDSSEKSSETEREWHRTLQALRGS